MAFTEKLKKEVRNLADGKCVICHKPFVEIHHILPQSEGGSDTIENAAPLCARCHDIYGDNPKKRKQIIEFRNRWYQVIENTLNFFPVKPAQKEDIILYHVVYENETFEDASNAIIELLVNAQKTKPDCPRFLFLDIDGHRNSAGGFDYDMFELMKDFILGNLMKYFTEVSLPIIKVRNPGLQRNDILVDDFRIYNADEVPKELQGKMIFYEEEKSRKSYFLF